MTDEYFYIDGPGIFGYGGAEYGTVKEAIAAATVIWRANPTAPWVEIVNTVTQECVCSLTRSAADPFIVKGRANVCE